MRSTSARDSLTSIESSASPGTTTHAGSARDFVFLSLSRDGRVADDQPLGRLPERFPDVTDCFLFCHGWLYDEAEARHEAARFFALLDQALLPLRDRVVPLRLALHWPSKPFANGALARAEQAPGLWPELERRFSAGARSRAHGLDLARLLRELHAAEVARSPEEEVELDALARRVAAAARQRGALPISPFHALSFWVMKRRAGEVGERFGREDLAPLWCSSPGAPRLHLIGHSFGAKLVTSMVLGGVRPESLTLLLGAFSAFAFAPAVPGYGRPGFYHRVLAERKVDGPIVVLRSDHDRALGTLYRAVTGSGQLDRHAIRPRMNGRRGRAPVVGAAGVFRHGGLSGRSGRSRYAGLRAFAPQPKSPGGVGRMATSVAAGALGAVGARGVDVPELDLIDAQQLGLPQYPIVNVDGSRVVRAKTPFIGAHRDIHHAEVANLVLLAAGYLVGGPTGIRPRPLDPCLAP